MTDCEWMEAFRQVLVGEREIERGDLENIMLTLVLYSAVAEKDLEAIQEDPTERRFVAILCRRCRADFFSIVPECRGRLRCAGCMVFRARKRLGSTCDGRSSFTGVSYVGWRWCRG